MPANQRDHAAMPAPLISFLIPFIATGISSDELEILTRQLKRTEACLPPARGTIDYRGEEIDGDGKRALTEHVRYDYSIRAQRYVIHAKHFVGGRFSPEWVSCSNDRYSFDLVRQGEQWLLSRCSPPTVDPAKQAEELHTFLGHFGYTLANSDRPLPALLHSRAHATMVVRIRPGTYVIAGRRKARETDRVTAFAAQVVVSADGEFAYAVWLRTVLEEDGSGRHETTTRNSVRNTADGPRLVTSKSLTRVFHGDRVAGFESRRTYEEGQTSELTVPEENTLTRFGLPEPELPRPQGPRLLGRNAGHGWLLIVPLLGVLLIVVGRHMARKIPVGDRDD